MSSIWAAVAAIMVGLALGATTSAQSAAELLERGIYAEETQGDHSAAIEIYKQIVADTHADRPTIAGALLRLGICYLKIDRQADAVRIFQRLEKGYSEQVALVAQIPRNAARAKLLPVPWRDQDERLVLRRVGTRGEMGSHVFILVLQARRHDDSTTSLVIDSQISRSMILVDTDTFQPKERLFQAFRTAAAAQRWTATYKPESVTLMRTAEGRSVTRDISVTQSLLDFDQIFHFLRRVPLEPGFAMRVPVVPRTLSQTYDASIRVIGRETVTVPYGTFEALKVDVVVEDLITDRFPFGASRKTCWYSTDQPKYLLRVEESGFTWELADVQIGKPMTAAHFEDDTVGLSLGAPAGWVILRGSRLDEALFVHLVAPGSVTLAELKVEPLSAPDSKLTALKMAEQRFERATGIMRGSREEPTSIALGDVAAAKVCFDYFSAARYPRVEYGFFFVHGGYRGTLTFSSIERDDWDTLKPTLDEIAGSLRFR